MNKNNLIVIEGLDGSGKATQAKILTETFESIGTSVKQISFPDYESESSRLVKMYLAGEVGTLNEVNAYAASMFYAGDRYISYNTKWGKAYRDGDIIISDRYTTSNAAHQMVKLPREEWNRYLDWLYHNEFSLMKLPPPTAVIYLDVSPNISRKLIAKRYEGTNTKPDIHEADLQYLLHCRVGALHAAEYLGWYIINCDDGENILPINTISNMINEYLTKEKGFYLLETRKRECI